MRALSPRERRVLAIGILVVAIGAMLEWVVIPFFDGFAERAADREELRNAYRRNDRILAGLPGWRLDARQQARTAPRFAIAAPTRMVGLESLTQRLSQAVRAAGGTVQSTQESQLPLPRDWIGIQSDTRMTIGQFVAVLTRLQNEEPYVVVDFLSVVAGPAGQPGATQSLVVRLAISAPVHVEPAASARGGAASGHA